MDELIRFLGIPTVVTEIAEDLPTLRARKDQIGYPCIIKPVDTPARVGGRKAIICTSNAEFDRFFQTWPDQHERLLIQRFFRGRRHNLYFVARDGKLLAGVETTAERTNRPDGTGLTVDMLTAAPNAGVHKHTRTLVERLYYTGVGCIQFIVNRESGDVCFLEMNSRLGASHAVIRAAGLDLVPAAIRLAHDEPLDELAGFSYPIGLRCAWTVGDLQGLGASLLNREITAREACLWLWTTVATFVRADCHLTWDWRDPLPTLAECARALRLGIFSREAE